MDRITRKFIDDFQNFFPGALSNKKILDVGSKNVNGTAREYFNNCEYVGVDIEEGDGVDIVGHLVDVSVPEDFFDIVICFNTIEHDKRWRETLRACCKKVVKGGLFIIFGPTKFSHSEICQINNMMKESHNIKEVNFPRYKNYFKIDRGDYYVLDYSSETHNPYFLPEDCPWFGKGGIVYTKCNDLLDMTILNPEFPSNGQSSYIHPEIAAYISHNVHHTESEEYYYNASMGDILASLAISGELGKFIVHDPYINLNDGVSVGLVLERLV